MRIIRQVGKSLEITTNAYKVHIVAMPQNMDEFLGLIEKENPHVKIEMVGRNKTLGENSERFYYYFKFSGFKASSSGITKRPSLRISTSSK